jgi:hypothetical protein
MISSSVYTYAKETLRYVQTTMIYPKKYYCYDGAATLSCGVHIAMISTDSQSMVLPISHIKLVRHKINHLDSCEN